VARSRCAGYCGHFVRIVGVVPIDPLRPAPHLVAQAVDVLRLGGLVAFPTETVYGLGARAFDTQAVSRVFAAKGRPLGHPLIAHVADAVAAASLARVWPDIAGRLASAFWPGPLTLVVERAAHVPAALSGGQDSIAVRVPSHCVARAILAALGEPVAAPSANRYQGVSPTSASHVLKELGDRIDLLLDGGACDAGIESTVVDVRGPTPRVLRLGAVGLSPLRRVACVPIETVRTNQTEERMASPGMDPRHYAPRAKLCLVDSARAALDLADDWASKGGLVGVVACGELGPRHAEPNVLVRSLGGDPVSYARNLYATMHDLDDLGVVAIVVQRVPEDEGWLAIADRLNRASHG
jgi:L-threonylcarbamoyladenylate synthase